VLELSGVTKRYGNSAAVSGLNLTVPAGQFVGVIGRSGAGKSTTLRMINRLTNPTEGRIVFSGMDVTTARGRPLREWRQRCAMIFQQFNLVGRLDVLDNVLLGRLGHAPAWRSMSGMWSADDREAAMAALDRLDMAQHASRRAEDLSGGQQQRVAICRALLQEPEMILADEPVASLDPRNSRIVMDALQRINRLGITVLCNLHSIPLAQQYCDRLVGMAHGRVVFDDVPTALTEQVARDLYDLEGDDAPPNRPAPSRFGAMAVGHA
jgi:phosphonate transport system ATP-binding protein